MATVAEMEPADILPSGLCISVPEQGNSFLMLQWNSVNALTIFRAPAIAVWHPSESGRTVTSSSQPDTELRMDTIDPRILLTSKSSLMLKSHSDDSDAATRTPDTPLVCTESALVDATVDNDLTELLALQESRVEVPVPRPNIPPPTGNAGRFECRYPCVHKHTGQPHTFARAEHRKRHEETIHSQQIKHVCGICQKPFGRRDNFMTHLKTHMTWTPKRRNTYVPGLVRELSTHTSLLYRERRPKMS